MEQYIYTYCFLRYDKPGGGHGLYSCSDNITDCFEDSKVLETLCSGNAYIAPENNSVWISNGAIDYRSEEEKLKIYHPEKFAYREIKTNGNDVVVFTFGKNLGRETIGPRPGNVVIYTLAGQPSEVSDYPCFYFGDRDFIRFSRDYFMRDPDDPDKYQDLENRKAARKLSSKMVEPGDIVTRESVHQFLLDRPDSDNILTGLFYALIGEHSGKKRPILICDKKDNIIFWIAAVTLLFPVQIARKIHFTTYDYLGTRNNFEIPDEFDICGVYSPTANDAPDEEATNYKFSKLKNNDNVIVFDIEKDSIPEYDADDFADIIHQFCMGNEGPLRSYHDYIIDHTSYRDYDRLYTEFYPINEVKEKLFVYYNKETQDDIINDIYPLLFDPDTSEEKMQMAINILSGAFKSNRINPLQVKEDLIELTRSLIIRKFDEISLLYRIEPIISLVGFTVKDLIKNYITNNISEIQTSVSNGELKTEKIGQLLSVFDPNEFYDDYSALSILCKGLCNTDEGKKVLTITVNRWIQEGMATEKPVIQPDAVCKLLRLYSDNADVYIAEIVRNSYRWNNTYAREVLYVMLNSEFGEKYFKEYKKYLWNSLSPYEAVYDSIKMIYGINSLYADELLEQFRDKLDNENPDTQKAILEKVLMDLTSKHNNYYDKLVRHVYRSYNFASEKEIAEFTYIYYQKILTQNILSMHPEWVQNALDKISCNNRKWKKAVENTEALNSDQRMDSNIRHKMLDVLNFNAEKGSSSDEEQGDKKGILGSVFNGLKNKFKK